MTKKYVYPELDYVDEVDKHISKPELEQDPFQGLQEQIFQFQDAFNLFKEQVIMEIKDLKARQGHQDELLKEAANRYNEIVTEIAEQEKLLKQLNKLDLKV